jgi:tetratricopeptide (TPR) repeat protein
VLASTGSDLDEALRLATRAKDLLPKNPDILDTLAWVYVKKQMTDEALAIYRNVVAGNPGNAVLRYHFAVALLQKGDKQEALGQCETALQSHPSKEDEAQIRELKGKITGK